LLNDNTCNNNNNNNNKKKKKKKKKKKMMMMMKEEKCQHVYGFYPVESAFFANGNARVFTIVQNTDEIVTTRAFS